MLVDIPPHMLDALERFAAEHRLPVADAVIVMLGDFLTSQGYLPIGELDEDSPVAGRA